MNWEALGAIANVLTAVGVIATLIYLSIQIRQNTKAVRSSSIQNLVQSFSTTAQAAVENEYIIPLLLKPTLAPAPSLKKRAPGCTSGSS